MLRNETTFIIGAGASTDFGFPLGDSLRNLIVELLAVENPNRSIDFKDPALMSVLRARAIKEVGVNEWFGHLEVYRRAAGIIRDGLPFARSIDSFLDGLRDEPEVEFLAKLAITMVILRAEARSPLIPYTGQAVNADAVRTQRLAELVGGWHAQLGQILYEGHTRETIDKVFERASFVIFNYDRCIEEFLITSLARRFALDRQLAMAAVARCQIIHPYGQVGGLLPDQENHVPFGEPEKHRLPEIATGIRTFTEAMEESVGDAVKDCVARADTVVFMGFGWLPQNMELLQATGRKTEATKVFATTMGMPKGEVDVVARQIDSILGRDRYTPVFMDDPRDSAEFINEIGDCRALMTNCWLRLTTS